MGLRAERLQLEWISAAEGLRFKEVMEKMESLRQGVTEQEVEETKRILEGRPRRARSKGPPLPLAIGRLAGD